MKQLLIFICEFFLQLGKLQIKTEQRDKRENLFSNSLFGTTHLSQNQASLLSTAVRKVKNRSGLIEKRPVTCLECSEEFCFNGCGDFNYDLFVRVPVYPTAQIVKPGAPEAKGKKGKGKKFKRQGKSVEAPPRDKKKGKSKRKSSPSKKK